MDNSAYEKENNLELSDVKADTEKAPDSQTQKLSDAEAQRPNRCNMAACRNLHEQFLKERTKMASSPWHQLKTVFLVGIIAILLLWVFVFAVLIWLDRV